MNHRILTCVLTAFTSPFLILGPGQAAFSQDEEASPLDPLVDEFVYPYLQYREYLEISSDLVAGGAAAVPSLLKRLPTANEVIQLRILDVLTQIGPDSEPALEELRLLLSSKSPSIRAAAAKGLGALGAAGEPALPDLLRALADPDEVTIGWAARAIYAVKPDYVRTQLAELLRRTGTLPKSVRLLSLRTWCQIAGRNPDNSAVADDLRNWCTIVHFTGGDSVRIADVLDL